MPQTLPCDQFSSSLGQFFANEASGFFQQEESGVLISAIFISRQKLENYRITGQTHVHVCVTGAGKVQVPAAALGHVPKSLVRGWDRLIIAAAANLAISIGLARDRTSHFAQRNKGSVTIRKTRSNWAVRASFLYVDRLYSTGNSEFSFSRLFPSRVQMMATAGKTGWLTIARMVLFGRRISRTLSGRSMVIVHGSAHVVTTGGYSPRQKNGTPWKFCQIHERT